MATVQTQINRSSALQILQRLTRPVVEDNKLNHIGFQEITLSNEGGSLITITLKFDGTWIASTPFNFGGRG